MEEKLTKKRLRLSCTRQGKNGSHLESAAPNIYTKVRSVVRPAHTNGVYEALVDVGGIAKTGNAGRSTMFPASWTKQFTVDSVNLAFANKGASPIKSIPGSDTFRGIANGVEIEMYVSTKPGSTFGKITSAFPAKTPLNGW
ncbi:MAG: EndoU domain-containing protein [candidate division SR1 bacterium]|nr:EndoU domain-containing protein [candidate division SR1 bacterium]